MITAVKEKGIMMSPMMVEALIYHRKTHTRRTAGLEKVNENPDNWQVTPTLDPNWWAFLNLDKSERINCKPRYLVGDILYIKERHKILDINISQSGIGVVQYLDGMILKLHYDPDSVITYNPDRWRSSMFMPKWASRLGKYEIVSVNPERLSQITDQDADLEGFYNSEDSIRSLVRFVDLWNILNTKNGHPFSRNDWVWDYGFKELENK